MNDHYELTRARVEMLKEADDGGANLSPRDYELMLLLADADALLEFKHKVEDADSTGDWGDYWDAVNETD